MARNIVGAPEGFEPWGADGDDQAIIVITVDENGTPYWSGIIYARDGFTDVDVRGEEHPTRGKTPSSTPTVSVEGKDSK